MRCRQEKNVDKQRLFCSQLLEQRSLYPLYPSLSIPLDAGKLPSLSMREVPDLMIVATEKMRFVKEVDGVVCLSPGSLAFGNSGGTFARITVYPLKEERREGSEGEWTELGVEAGEKVDSLVAKRCKVEIVNIWCVCLISRYFAQDFSRSGGEVDPMEVPTLRLEQHANEGFSLSKPLF